MIKKLLLIGIIISMMTILFTGCYYNEAKHKEESSNVVNKDALPITHEEFEKLQIGMTSDEVLKCIKQPHKMNFEGADKHITYMEWPAVDGNIFYVTFENGKLDSKMYIDLEKLKQEAQAQ